MASLQRYFAFSIVLASHIFFFKHVIFVMLSANSIFFRNRDSESYMSLKVVNHSNPGPGWFRAPHMPARVAAGLILFAAGWCIPGAIRTAQGGLGVEWWRPGGYTFGRLSAIYIVHLVPPRRVTIWCQFKGMAPFFLQRPRGFPG